MANQMIALQARAPQTDILGPSIARNAQMINMMRQQEAAERQAAAAAQQMEFQAAEEARKAALHTPAMAKATAEAQAAQIETAMDFNNFVRVGLQYARSPDQVIDIARKIAAQPQFKDDYFQHAIQVALQDMPSDPSQFLAWKDKTRFDTLSTDKQLSQKLIELTNGGETWTTAVPEYAGSGRAPAEVPGTRQKAPVGITYIKTDKGIVPMPKEMTGGDGGLVGGARGGADTVYGFGQYGSPDKPLSGLTIGEVQDFQKNTLIPATRGKIGAGPDKGTGAVGTYQITYGTLKQYAPRVLGPNWRNTPFTPEVQDQIARAIYEDVKNGDLKQTWAGMPSNKPGAYANVPWEQAREKIARVESGGGRGITLGQPIPGTGKKPATELPPEKKVARDNAVQDLYDAVVTAHQNGHLVADDQSYLANRVQELLQGRTYLPGGTAKKTSLDDIDAAATQLLRLFVEKGTSGTLNTKAEQDMFLKSVGGSSSTYETRLRTIRNFAKQNGIKLNDYAGAKTTAPKGKTSTRPAGVTEEEWQYMTPEERAHWRR